MTQSTNPFSTDAITLAHGWVGRSDCTEEFSDKRQLNLEGGPVRGMMILGMHGIGKSALLRRLQEIADAQNRGTMTRFIDASQGVSVIDSLHAIVRGKVRQPTRMRMVLHWIGWHAKNILRFLHKWLVRFAIKQLPEPPRFMGQFIQFGKELRHTNNRMVFFIDDLHTASRADLQHLAAVFKTTVTENLPILFVVAGHRILLRQFEEVNVNIRWLLDKHELHWLSHGETFSFLVKTAEPHGKEFCPEALEEIYRISRGYPYLVQLLGRQVWKEGRSRVMTAKDVHEAFPAVKRHVGNHLFQSMRDKLGPAELEFVMAMASLPATERTLGNIFEIIGGEEADHATTIANLHDLDIVYLVAANQIEFKAPLFDQYLQEHAQSVDRY